MRDRNARPRTSRRRDPGCPLTGLLALAALAAAPAAQVAYPDAGEPGTANPFLHEDGTFRTPGALASEFADWIVMPELGAAYKFFHTGVEDPGVQFVIAPGFSSHPTKWERFRLQFPHPKPSRVSDTALVVAFHGFSISEADVWMFSQLPQECADRGYYLLAPLGLGDENWGNVESQVALDHVLDLVQLFFDVNEERIYTAGFSMGGCSALSYALRHQDPDDLRVAGVISHTSTLDLVDSYDQGEAGTQASLESAMGGDPVAEAFSYRRVSPLVALAGAPDPDFTNVSNLLHVPFYYHVNLLDTDAVLLAQNAIFRDWLVANGATASINEVTVSTPPKHAWSTMDHTAALDFVSGYTLPTPPDSIEFYADRVAPYLYTDVRALAPDQVARYDVDVDALVNSFVFDESKHVEEIAFDLAAMGLEPAEALFFVHETLDGTPDTVVLGGYVNPPSSVTVDGGPPDSWSHDPLAQEVTVVPRADGLQSNVALGAPVPAADFSASAVSGTAPLTVDFTDESWGSVSGWDWSFGDTGTSTLQHPQHTYALAGSYTVTLTVSGPGGTDDETKVGYVEVLDPPPVPDFTADVTSGEAPLVVRFTDLTAGAVDTWEWDFGDGGDSTLQHPEHTYTAGGSYTVALTATGPGGSATETKVAYVVVTDPAPAADFSADVTSGEAPLVVQFSDASTGTISSWSWDFGDGGDSTESSPQHTFTEPGTYTVVLTVTGPGGVDTETKEGYVTVTEPPPDADFTADVTSGPAPLTVQFTDTTTGGAPFEWSWTFGDDLGTSTAQHPQHTYTEPDTYTVVLAVTAASGTDVEIKTGYITVTDE